MSARTPDSIQIRRNATVLAFAVAALAPQCYGTDTPRRIASTAFQSPLTYEQALVRLGEDQDAKTTRPSESAFPLIGEKTHYDIRDRLWIRFGGPQIPDASDIPPDASSQATPVVIYFEDSLQARSRAQRVAGTLSASESLQVKSVGALTTITKDFASPPPSIRRILRQRGFTRIAASGPNETYISSSFTTASVQFSPGNCSSRIAFSYLKATGESESPTSVVTSLLGGGLCGVATHTALFEDEVKKMRTDTITTQGPNPIVGAGAMLTVRPATPAEKAEREAYKQARLAQLPLTYRFFFKIDRDYADVAVRCFELVGFSNGQYKARKEIKFKSGGFEKDFRTSAARTTPFFVDAVVDSPLEQGFYEVELEAHTQQGRIVNPDKRRYRFDGQTFKE